MQSIEAKNGQTPFDLAVMHCGSFEAAWSLAKQNGISVTSELIPGQEMKLPGVVDGSVVQYMQVGGYSPATQIKETGSVPVPSGIGYWTIGVDFIVS